MDKESESRFFWNRNHNSFGIRIMILLVSESQFFWNRNHESFGIWNHDSFGIGIKGVQGVQCDHMKTGIWNHNMGSHNMGSHIMGSHNMGSHNMGSHNIKFLSQDESQYPYCTVSVRLH